MFEDLQGIQKGREVVMREKTILEELIEKGEEMVEKYSETNYPYQGYQLIEQKVFQFPTYNEQDLCGLVTAFCNKSESTEKKRARGMYTGALASVLTKRNKEQGKPTKLHFNGNGNSFPYLLNCAHTLDEVIVENYKGHSIMNFVGENKGSVNNIILRNIVGDFTGVGIAFEEGHAKDIIIANIKGYYTGSEICQNGGCAENVVINGAKGDECGFGIADSLGNIKNLAIVDVKGKNRNVKRFYTSKIETLFSLHNKIEDILIDYKAKKILTSLNIFSNPAQIQSLLDKIKQANAPIDEVLSAVEELGKAMDEVKV